MDGREEITLSGSSPYYFNKGVGVGVGDGGSVHNSGHLFGSSTQSGLSAPPGFKNISNNPNVLVEGNVSGSQLGPIQQVENSSPSFGYVNNMGLNSGGEKKKRGRPRKYGPDGANMSLALSPMSSDPSPGSGSVEKKNKGRPKGTGRKQRLSSLGEWMNSSAGTAFTPHVIHIAAGEDIASQILLFAQQRPRALCILSANGSVSTVTLRHTGSSHESVTYEGRFQILCLSGSYILSEEGGPRDRTGGLSISICTPDGHVIGGAVGGKLIAGSLVQAVVCSFVYGDPKPKTNREADAKADHDQPTEKSSTPGSAGPCENITPTLGTTDCPPTSSWQGSMDPNTEIDLANG